MDDEDFVPISALQHYLYCPRQCALIHVERQWAESRHTAEGRLLHERADKPAVSKRGDVRVVSAMPIVHNDLGITGVADVVEFLRTSTGEQPYPVEYKRGRPKAHRADEVQLCAQALCLEAMLDRPVPEGALFYGAARRRRVVRMDADLRTLTQDTILAVRQQVQAGSTPRATYEARRCDACSLIGVCQPRIVGRRGSVASWLDEQLRE